MIPSFRPGSPRPCSILTTAVAVRIGERVSQLIGQRTQVLRRVPASVRLRTSSTAALDGREARGQCTGQGRQPGRASIFTCGQTAPPFR
jgi:hypothetical protein